LNSTGDFQVIKWWLDGTDGSLEKRMKVGRPHASKKGKYVLHQFPTS